jgi:hypothetical protein
MLKNNVANTLKRAQKKVDEQKSSVNPVNRLVRN